LARVKVQRLEEAIIPEYKLTEEETKYLEEPCVDLVLRDVPTFITPTQVSTVSHSRAPVKR
jgi:hypothetical protein